MANGPASERGTVGPPTPCALVGATPYVGDATPYVADATPYVADAPPARLRTRR
ncbi:hypothetical protein [Candidatus Halobonum tyrrellensis]|uniref:hypothetical protein n=1 Tax=Candidatus Halobonum tyrrellensis TaxID=1431545 RepID=UPI0013784ADE|nr:hypothetical protein [Candidatus Halobonum tyrrellensis]